MDRHITDRDRMKGLLDGKGTFPPVRVFVSGASREKKTEPLVIRVVDEGCGIPKEGMDRIWTYLFTTVDPQNQEWLFDDKYKNCSRPPGRLSASGTGLSRARMTCRYFGGSGSCS